MRTFAQKPKGPQQATPAKPAVPGRAHHLQSHEVNSTLHLQLTLGNRAALRMLQPDAEKRDVGLTGTASPGFGHDSHRIARRPAAGAIQTKSAIQSSGDLYEQEADRISEQIIRMPEPELQRTCACDGACPKCQTEQLGHGSFLTIRVVPGDRGQIEAPPHVHDALRSPGQPIDQATRAFMEPRFGHDFGQVRVHTDEKARDSAHAVNALAYTAGGHLVFGAGQYSPATALGRRLLAHELVHSVQQGFAANPLSRQVGDSGSVLQRKEDSAVVPPKAPKCETGPALHWGQDTTCSRFGVFEGLHEHGEGKTWKSIGCYNHWPFSLEVYARNQLGLSGAASCKARHVKEIATVSLNGKEVELLCSDNFGSDSAQLIEMSPLAMQELSGALDNLPQVKVCYSGSKQPGLREWDGKLPPYPEVADCITEGCPIPTDVPKLKDTGWPKV